MVGHDLVIRFAVILVVYCLCVDLLVACVCCFVLFLICVVFGYV